MPTFEQYLKEEIGHIFGIFDPKLAAPKKKTPTNSEELKSESEEEKLKEPRK